MADEQTTTQMDQNGSALTADDVRQIVDDAINASITANDERMATAEQSLSNDIAGLGEVIRGGNDEVIKAIAAGNEDTKAGASGEVVTVQVSDSQWATMQKCWGWAKAGAQVGIFLELLLLFFVCAMLGGRLWDAFSKGWRK